MEPSKKDWKMFREKIGRWQEAYMEILNQRYIALLSNEELPASERFWKLQQAIQVDRHRPGVCLELRKQTMVYDLAALIADCAITVEDLAEFSDEVKERVAILLQQPLGEYLSPSLPEEP